MEHIIKAKLLTGGVLLAVGANLGLVMPAFAQEGASSAAMSAEEVDPGSEIVVSARRRVETLQEVPLAVSVISGDALAQGGIKNVNDLYATVPGLYFTNASNAAPSSDFTYLMIRGVGFNGGLEPATGVFVDGMYQPQLGFDIGFLDLARLEVLRGPQGTLFGRNTQAGALNLVTRKPGRELSVRATAEAASFDTYRGMASISGPVVGDLSAGIAGEYYRTDGFIDNATLNRDGTPSERTSVRGALRFNRGDADVILAADYSYKTGNELGYGVALDCKCYTSRDDEYVRDTQKNYGVQLNAEFTMTDRLSFSSISGYRYVKSDTTLDMDARVTGQTTVTANGSPAGTEFAGSQTYGGLGQRLAVRQEFYSQEFRLNYESSSLDALLGAYLFDQSQDQYRRFAVGPDVTTVAGTAALVPLLILEDYTTDRSGAATFGQASWRPMPKVEVTVGARYSSEDIRIGGSRLRNIFKVENANPQFFEPRGSDTFSNFSWTGSLAYQFDPGTQLYATAARGWKAGGFNRFPGSSVAALPYGSETSTNYELGLKSRWFENRLVANLAAFYIDIQDQQLTTVIRDPNNIPVSTIANAGSSRSKGFEAEITAYPVDALTLSFNGSYTQARFKEFQLCSSITVCVDRSGQRFDATPDWTLNASASYRIPVSDDTAIELTADYHYVSSTLVPETTFTSPLGSRLTVPAYDRVNLRAEVSNGPWSLIGYVNNVLDSYDYFNTSYQLFDLRGQANQLVQPLAPRTFGVIGSYKF